LRPRPLRSTFFPYTTLFRSDSHRRASRAGGSLAGLPAADVGRRGQRSADRSGHGRALPPPVAALRAHDREGRTDRWLLRGVVARDRKSTRLNSSHVSISYAV